MFRWTVTLTVLLLGLAVGGPAGSQPLDLDTPADSPLWWTLTDEISPAELREIYLDESGHLKRYREAVIAGLEEPLPPSEAPFLAFYYHPKMTPELDPMWLAWSFFGHALIRQGDVEVREGLSAYEISPSGIETILVMGHEQYREERALFDAVRKDAEEFHRIQREYVIRGTVEESRVANRELKDALERGDFTLLRQVSGKAPEELARMQEAFDTSPASETAAENLPELREQLSEHDWNVLRRYLLEEVMSQSGSFKDMNYLRGGTL